jgi:hypothetical protein
MILPLGKGQPTESVGQSGRGTLEVMENRSKFLKKEAPSQDTLCLQVRKGEIFVIGVDVKLTAAEQHGAVFAKSLNNAEKLLRTGGIIALSRGEFAREEGNWGVLLHDDGTKLIVRGVRVHVETEAR